MLILNIIFIVLFWLYYNDVQSISENVLVGPFQSGSSSLWSLAYTESFQFAKIFKIFIDSTY